MLPSISQLAVSPLFRRLRYRTALVIYAAIVAMGSIPGARAEIGMLASGIVLHTVAYGMLAYLIFTGGTGTPRARAIKAVLTVAAMGAGDELLQSLLPYRVGSIGDLLVDCNAAIIVSGLCWAFLPDTASEPRHSDA